MEIYPGIARMYSPVGDGAAALPVCSQRALKRSAAIGQRASFPACWQRAELQMLARGQP